MFNPGKSKNNSTYGKYLITHLSWVIITFFNDQFPGMDHSTVLEIKKPLFPGKNSEMREIEIFFLSDL